MISNYSEINKKKPFIFNETAQHSNSVQFWIRFGRSKSVGVYTKNTLAMKKAIKLLRKEWIHLLENYSRYTKKLRFNKCLKLVNKWSNSLIRCASLVLMNRTF